LCITVSNYSAVVGMYSIWRHLTARNKDNFKLTGIVYKCPLKVILGSVVNC